MDRKEMITGLRANNRVKWTDADETRLMALSCEEFQAETLQALGDVFTEMDEMVGEAVAERTAAETAKAEADAIFNAMPPWLQKKVKDGKVPAEDPEEEDEEKMKKNSLVSNASTELIERGLELAKGEVDGFVSAILANKANTFTEEQLRAKPVVELKALHALATAPVANFSGRGGAVPPVPPGSHKEEALETPTINWGKK